MLPFRMSGTFRAPLIRHPGRYSCCRCQPNNAGCRALAQGRTAQQVLFRRKSTAGAASSTGPDVNSPQYQFLQQSVVPTMHFQKSLPRLPIPNLEKTCERYLSALEPLVSASELQSSRRLVQEFKDKDGPELDKLLRARDKANKHTSYISGPWFDMYLSSRKPLPLNFNPFLALKDDPRPEYNQQVVRASNMVVSSLRFLRSLRSNQLEPVVFHLNPDKSDTAFYRRTMRFLPEAVAWYGSALAWKAYPLDMSQFGNLFGSTRVPQLGRDKLVADKESRHLLVMRNGHCYSVQALDEQGNLFAPEHYRACLEHILADPRPPPLVAVPALTAGPRDDWARARQALEGTGNGQTLRRLDSALFALVLDQETFPGTSQEEKIAHHFLHGPVHNRWFDKSFSLLLTGDGHAAVNFEHAWGDGVAVLRYFNDLFTDSTEQPQVHPGSKPSTDAGHYVERLDFKVNDSVAEAVKQAVNGYKEATGSLQLSALKHAGLSRDLIKSSGLSPDSVAQLSFQLAYHLEHGTTPATYESCSTSAFRHGRTETVRPATMATKRCVEALSTGTSPQRARPLLEECSRVHSKLTKEAAMGQGFDRHLFALRLLAEERGGPMPRLFGDPSFVKANHFCLSTSTLHGTAFSGGGFAPVVPDGYGLGYGMVDGCFGVLTSAYAPHRDASRFASALTQALNRICAAMVAR